MERQESIPAIDWKLLLVLLVLALVVRIGYARSGTAVIENDGAEYARIAENLSQGNGYIGIMGAPQLTYAPFYPVLIASATIVLRDSELAGRLIAVLFGTLLVLPVYFIAFRLYGRGAAATAGFFVAAHALLIGYSAAVYNETVYLTLLMTAIACGLHYLGRNDVKRACLVGVAFGLAYLSRVEAAGLFALTIAYCAACALLRTRSWARVARESLAAVAAFLAVAAPYAAFLSYQTGVLRLEAKNKINFTVGSRIAQGLSIEQAEFGIGPDLREEGPALNENAFTDYSPYPMTLSRLGSYVIGAARRNRHSLNNEFFHFLMCSPIVLVLVVIGAFSQPWNLNRLRGEFYLLTMMGFVLFMLLAAHYVQFRYGLPLLPFLMIWSASGVIGLAQWLRLSAREMGLPKRLIDVSVVVPAMAALSVVALAAFVMATDGVQELNSGGAKELPVKQAGLWLRHEIAGSTKIVDSRTAIPYYSGATLIYFPETDGTTALRYIEAKKPGFIVLTDFSARSTKYLGEWMDSGVPSTNAELVYRSGTGAEKNRVAIYRWHDHS